MKLLINDLKKLPQIIGAFFLFGWGISLTNYANLGMSPWEVFHQGLSFVTGLSFGHVSMIVGLIVVVLSFSIKVYPGIGTVLNIYLIGVFIDLIMGSGLLHTPDSLALRFVMMLVGLVLISFAAVVYIMPGIGAGPRDALMLGLIKKTGKNTRVVKPMMEAVVLLCGYLLGGTVGIGTIFIWFIPGYVIDYFFKKFSYNPKVATHRHLLSYFKKEEAYE